MKLLRIGMYNLASFEGEQVIDLESEPLKSADLFSIVGETGSGKSTVLDAVCLALYGLAPRSMGRIILIITIRRNRIMTRYWSRMTRAISCGKG